MNFAATARRPRTVVSSIPPTRALPSPLTGISPSWMMQRPAFLVVLGFWFAMVALSFSQPTLHSVAMKLRWPVLFFTAGCSVMCALSVGRWGFSAAAGWMLAFIGVTAASAFYSVDPSYSFQRSISLALLFATSFIGATLVCQLPGGFIRITEVLWWLGCLVVVGGFLYTLGRLGPGGRYTGLHGRATGAGTYGALFLPICLFMVRYRLQGTTKFVGIGICCLTALQIGLAGARMAMVTAMLSSLYLGSRFFGKKFLISGILGGLFLVPLVMLDQRVVEKIQAKSEKLLRAESISTFTGRLERWVFAVEQWREKPIFGHGFGASRTLASEVDPRRFDLKPGEVFNLHSDQLEVLMDTGMVGFFFFAMFWLCLIVCGIRSLGFKQNIGSDLALCYWAAVFYAFIDTFMHGGFLAAGGGVAAFTWPMIAIALAANRTQSA